MAMKAREFMEKFQQVKGFIQSGGATPELVAGHERLTRDLKDKHSPEEIKATISADGDVATDLEEAMTTLFMLYVQQRGSG